MPEGQRIDGWKAIGGYFGRDRTTAIRWANDRALPVHRMPGGKRATVYAFKHELDDWAASRANLDADTDEPEDAPPESEAPPRRTRRMWLLSSLAVVLVLTLGVATWAMLRPASPGASPLPADPEVATLYLQARDDWAKRSPASIDQAIAGLQQVIRRDPGFAPAHAALADAFLLAREFGALDDERGFESARASADRALRLAPDLAGAHRALGFVLYWWDHDPRAADRAFQRATALAPGDAQTHFWYGNILSDNGAHISALRELNAARLIEPGSVAIQVDLAWATWTAGDRRSAEARLNALKISNPDFAVIHDCLAMFRIAEGDYAGYVEAFSRFAAVRGGGDLTAQAERLRSAMAAGPDALKAAMMAQALKDATASPKRDHGWPAFLLSLERDRAGLIRILDTAERRKERWGHAGLVTRMQAAWAADPEVSARLARLRMPLLD